MQVTNQEMSHMINSSSMHLHDSDVFSIENLQRSAHSTCTQHTAHDIDVFSNVENLQRSAHIEMAPDRPQSRLNCLEFELPIHSFTHGAE